MTLKGDRGPQPPGGDGPEIVDPSEPGRDVSKMDTQPEDDAAATPEGVAAGIEH